MVKNHRLLLVNFTDALDLMMSACVHEWQSIFQNYSYHTYAGKICEGCRLHAANSDITTDQSKHFEFSGYLYKNLLQSLEAVAL